MYDLSSKRKSRRSSPSTRHIQRLAHASSRHEDDLSRPNRRSTLQAVQRSKAERRTQDRARSDGAYSKTGSARDVGVGTRKWTNGSANDVRGFFGKGRRVDL